MPKINLFSNRKKKKQKLQEANWQPKKYPQKKYVRLPKMFYGE